MVTHVVQKSLALLGREALKELVSVNWDVVFSSSSPPHHATIQCLMLFVYVSLAAAPWLKSLSLAFTLACSGYRSKYSDQGSSGRRVDGHLQTVSASSVSDVGRYVSIRTLLDRNPLNA
jgi:hypothetical protein